LPELGEELPPVKSDKNAGAKETVTKNKAAAGADNEKGKPTAPQKPNNNHVPAPMN
jgi:hypothetical protein